MFVRNTISIHVHTCTCVIIGIVYVVYALAVGWLAIPFHPPSGQPLYNDIQAEIAMPVMSTDKQTGNDYTLFSV